MLEMLFRGPQSCEKFEVTIGVIRIYTKRPNHGLPNT